MQAELKALDQPNHPINVSMRSEASYGEVLDAEIEKARKLADEIRKFEEETFGRADLDVVEDRDTPMREQRLAALRQEYDELREELRHLSGGK
jgi:hypothetical protein